MVDLVKEMVESGLFPETMLQGASEAFDESTKIGQKVKEQNEKDVKKYQDYLQALEESSQPQ